MYVLYLLLGGVAGLVGGLFGVGGGVVVVPILLFVFAAQGFDAAYLTQMALATSLAAMVVTSSSSALAHLQKKAVVFPSLFRLAIGVIFGAVLGVLSAVNLSGTALQLTFAAFLAYIGIQMVVGFGFSGEPKAIDSNQQVVAGGVVGFVSMLFGIGGGSMTVPYLSWRGLPAQQAVATSAVLGVPIAIMGAVLYLLAGLDRAMLPDSTLGYIYLPAFMGIILTSIPAARMGAGMAHKLPERTLKRAFGGFLLFVSLALLAKNLTG